jgi:CMP/dCMP kinase
MTDHITITGDLGSGKSTVSKHLVNAYGYKRIATGDIQRQMAQELGVTTLELNKMAEVDPSIDREIDSIFESLRYSTESIVVDSRLAWHFLPRSFKVKLQVSPFVAAERVRLDLNRINEAYEDQRQALAGLRARRKEEVERFKRIYGVNIEDEENYDLVIDTTLISPHDVAQLIRQLMAFYKTLQPFDKRWISPQMLVPTHGLLEQQWKKPHQDSSEIPEQISLFLSGSAITITNQSDVYYIVDGHQRISQALKHGLPAVPVEIVSETELNANIPAPKEEFFDLRNLRQQIRQWQEWHSFHFPEYYQFD